MIVAQGNLPDVFPDVDTGRAGPLAWSGAFFGSVLPHDATGDGRQINNVLRADALAGAATGAFLLVHHRQSIRSHGDGIKRAGLYTGSQAQAADRANLHATA